MFWDIPLQFLEWDIPGYPFVVYPGITRYKSG